MLEEVVGDDEVLRFLGDCLEQLAVVDHVDLGQVPVGQLGTPRAACRPAGGRRNGLWPWEVRQRLVEGADLQAFAGQEAGRELAACVEIDRGRVDWSGRILLRLGTESAHLQQATRSMEDGFPNHDLRPQPQRRPAPRGSPREPARADPPGPGGDRRQRLQRRLAGAAAHRVPRGDGARAGREPRLRAGAQPRRARAPGRPADPAQQRRRVRAALRRGDAGPAAAGAEMVAGVLLTERDPALHRLGRRGRRPHPDGLRLPARRAARGGARGPDPLGPTGGAALYRARRLRRGRRLRRAHLPLLRGPRPGAADGRRGRPLPARRRGPGAARLLGQPRRARAARSSPAPAGAAATCCAATG